MHVRSNKKEYHNHYLPMAVHCTATIAFGFRIGPQRIAQSTKDYSNKSIPNALGPILLTVLFFGYNIRSATQSTEKIFATKFGITCINAKTIHHGSKVSYPKLGEHVSTPSELPCQSLGQSNRPIYGVLLCPLYFKMIKLKNYQYRNFI